MQRQVRIDFYKVSLMKLPISFFLMCANLCKVDEGLAMCYSEGVLIMLYLYVYEMYLITYCVRAIGRFLNRQLHVYLF